MAAAIVANECGFDICALRRSLAERGRSIAHKHSIYMYVCTSYNLYLSPLKIFNQTNFLSLINDTVKVKFNDSKNWCSNLLEPPNN